MFVCMNVCEYVCMDGWMDVNKHKRRKKNGRIYIDGRHRETGTTPFSVQLFR